MIGHLPDMHRPDNPPEHPDKLRIMIGLMEQKLQEAKRLIKTGEGRLEITRLEQHVSRAQPLTSENGPVSSMLSNSGSRSNSAKRRRQR